METAGVPEGIEPEEVMYFFKELSHQHRCSR